MCTLTITRNESEIWLVTNRDESRRRAAALPPCLVERNGRHRLMPIDPEGGGSWVGVNDAGLAAALLNLAAARRPSSNTPPSRGTLVAAALRATSVDEAVRRLASMPLREFRGFTLVLLSAPGELKECRWDGDTWRVTPREIPALFVSSGIDQAAAEAGRTPVFQNWLKSGAKPSLETLLSLHRRQSRADDVGAWMIDCGIARTLSITAISLETRRARLWYDGEPWNTAGGRKLQPMALEYEAG